MSRLTQVAHGEIANNSFHFFLYSFSSIFYWLEKHYTFMPLSRDGPVPIGKCKITANHNHGLY